MSPPEEEEPESDHETPAARHFLSNVFEVFNFMSALLQQRRETLRLGQEAMEMLQEDSNSRAQNPSGSLKDLIKDRNEFARRIDVVRKAVRAGSAAAAYDPFLEELAFCRVVDYFLLYISELLALIFRTRPETLRSDEKISVEQILGHSSLEELIDTITERKLVELAHTGAFSLDKYLKQKLKFEFYENDQDLERAVELVERRNLYVHNRGVVNRRYRDRIPNCTHKLGDRLVTGERDASDALKFLSDLVISADMRAVENFGLPLAPMPPGEDLKPDGGV